MSALQAQLKADLTRAMRAGERPTMSVLRTALAAIANAEAQAVPHTPASQMNSTPIAGATAGLGSTDIPRRTLTDDEMREVIGAERSERLMVADTLHEAGRGADAQRLRDEASVLERYL
ncbi:hypothetical protein [Nocardioides sp.]|uniref:hypothetical protein n=1 Tax=Nocardioides sp. TaxID=35761 RepID=UPI00273436EB|nr:hypothetical protein [Nocardioides sp.]MDP3889937.1 hypothetical protein [Nocardioides sp.]